VTFGRHAGQWREPGGLTVQVMRPWHYAGGHLAHPMAPGLIGALAGADVVHTHHLRSAPSRIAAVTARVRGARTVVTDHGLQGGDWRGLLPRLFDRFLLVSAASARELGSPPERTRLIYGGVDAERYRPDPGAHRAGVLFVGRLTPHKGVDRLIPALPDGASLTIAGSTGHDPWPPERDYPNLLRRLANGRDVRFLGPAPDGRLPALYREAAVFVLPSVERTCYGRSVRVSELLGLVVLEAMASGTPVICSRLGGLTEVVEDGVTGYLVEPGNLDELHDRLAELLGDPVRAARMGRAGRERVLARFTWRACAERCLSAYSELLDRSTRPATGTRAARLSLKREHRRSSASSTPTGRG
jgi:glycosyltransferase involved in cell wall biosynthesis